jgi:predicted RNA-binding Zn ribbon-like protein
MSAIQPERIFELIGGHPALDLVNTLDWRFRERGQEELLASHRDLIAFSGQTGLLAAKTARVLRNEVSPKTSERVLAETRELREALAEVFYAQLDGRRPDSTQIATLERFFREAREREKLVWNAPNLFWELSGAESDAELPLWLLARSACSLLLAPDMRKLRACHNAECRWLFLDTSKNHTRRWCDMAVCGNRMKARRFKAQQRA